MDASELARALQQAHVNHIRQRLQHESYWQAQLSAGLGTLGEQPAGTLVDATVIAGVVDEWLHNINTAQGLEPIIVQVSEAVLSRAATDPVSVGELLDEQHFEAILEQALRLDTLREQAIHACLNHPLVSEMVSEMLYTGIKNFLLEENALARLPGVSSMMKLGRRSVGKAMGGLEDSIRVYLRHNIRATLRTGEQWLNQQLTNERIAELARDGYRRLAAMQPADAIQRAPDDLVADITRHACAIADQSARRDYSRRLVSTGIHAAVEALAQWSLPALLSAMGTTGEARVKVLAPALAAGAGVLDEQRLLAPWIEQALGDFYRSDDCRALLEQALG
jgi:hypothetical protein